VAQPLRGLGGHRDSSEIERERGGGGGGHQGSHQWHHLEAEMATQWRSIEVAGGAPMGRWFRA
jgi:hypothetical protein